MKRRDGPSFDAGDKNAVRIILVVLNEITRCLFGWNSNEGDALISWFEPNNLWLVLLAFGLTA